MYASLFLSLIAARTLARNLASSSGEAALQIDVASSVMTEISLMICFMIFDYYFAEQILFVSPFAAISGERAMRKKREKKPLEYQGFFLGCVCISGGVRGTSGRWVTALIYGGAVCGGVLEGCESWWGFRRRWHTFHGIYRNTREPGSRVHARGGDGMDATPSALGYAA